MPVSRETKCPSKFRDCVTGDEIENIFRDIIDNNNLEQPLHCKQIDGKTNNVTFTTLPDRIEIWKNAIHRYFGKEKSTSSLKSGTVIKIICELW